MENAAANEDPVRAVFGIDPTREVKRGLDEQKLAVRVPDTYRKVLKMAGNFKEEVNDEPFVFEVVAESNLAVEVGDFAVAVGGGGAEAGRRDCGGGESEGFVLPYVVGGVTRESAEDLMVEGLEVRGEISHGGGGGDGGARV